MSGDVRLKALTPILIVDTIESCLAFWQTVGFTPGMTVPEAPPHAFAILSCGDVELMLQTRASARGDVPAVADAVRSSVLYLSVDALDPVVAALGDAPVAVPRRTTFYGADEIFVEDPAGNIIGFAAHANA